MNELFLLQMNKCYETLILTDVFTLHHTNIHNSFVENIICTRTYVQCWRLCLKASVNAGFFFMEFTQRERDIKILFFKKNKLFSNFFLHQKKHLCNALVEGKL